jgi:hypothetical protein
MNLKRWHAMKLYLEKFRMMYLNKCLALCTIVLMMGSCMNLDTETKIRVKDSGRHYYPIVQGQELQIVYEIENTGDFPLNVNEILPTCGCILVDETTKTNIPSKGSIFLKVTYNSNKNIRLVNHYIYLYGNFNKTKPLALNFDVHVVPDALYTKDYEELYKSEIEKEGNIESMVDGNENEKGYYVK